MDDWDDDHEGETRDILTLISRRSQKRRQRSLLILRLHGDDKAGLTSIEDPSPPPLLTATTPPVPTPITPPTSYMSPELQQLFTMMITQEQQMGAVLAKMTKDQEQKQAELLEEREEETGVGKSTSPGAYQASGEDCSSPGKAVKGGYPERRML